MVDVAIENSSVNTRNAIRHAAHGTKVFNIGTGQEFVTIEDAVIYLQGLPTTELFETIATTGSLVAPTQGDYNIIGSGTDFQNEIRAGDFISVDGDANGIFDIAPIFYQIRFFPESATSLWLAEPIAGAAAGTTFTIIRPKNFVFKLVSQDHEETGSNINIPNGINLSIIGNSPSLNHLYLGGSGTAFLLQPRYGKLDFSNFGFISTVINKAIISPPVVTTPYWNSPTPSLQESSLIFSVNNVTINGTGVASVKASEININGLQYNSSEGAGLNFRADSVVIQNYAADTHNAGDCLVVNEGGLRLFRQRECVLQNAFVRRFNSQPLGAGGAIEWGSGGITAGLIKNFNMHNVDVYDEQQGHISDFALIINCDLTNNTAKHFISEVTSDNTGLGSNANFASPADIVKRNVTDRAGTAI